MSYVQGTKVRVTGEFRNADTKALEDPVDVQVSIWRPGADDATIIRKFSDNDGSIVRVSIGLYQTVIDTTPEAGEWKYVFEATGADAVAKLERLRVRARPAVIP